ncbi:MULTISPECIES: hypothetical protein [Lactococcus]|uniref:hypothetical protein n=1 Tax=Lactococcus TaxID=1357 RepID=UPI00203C9758|nr:MULTISPECIES: hypothetical protein [Lactococcus]
MGKSILGLSNKEARDYFPEARNYVTVNLPPYYDVGALLNKAVKEIWSQRLVIRNLEDESELINAYVEKNNNELTKLCVAVVKDEEFEPIFNQNWLKDKYKIDETIFINKEVIASLSEVISNTEINDSEYPF